MESIQTDEWASKPYGKVVIQTEDIQPGENLEGEMMYEVEKPLYEKAMSLAIQFQAQKKKKKKGYICGNYRNQYI